MGSTQIHCQWYYIRHWTRRGVNHEKQECLLTGAPCLIEERLDRIKCLRRLWVDEALAKPLTVMAKSLPSELQTPLPDLGSTTPVSYPLQEALPDRVCTTPHT